MYPVYRILPSGLVGVLLGIVLGLFTLLCSGQTYAAPAPYTLKEIRGGVYWLSDGAYNTLFIVSTQGVIAIDPLPTLGKRYLEAIASVTDKPVTHIIYSHAHLDHIGAAALFPQSAQVIAQADAAKILARRKDPRVLPPIRLFSRDDVLKVGNQTVELHYRGPNHAEGNTFIYLPRQKILMLVDVVYPGYMPYPNLGIASDIPGYIAAHQTALAFDFTDFVGGHVDRIGTRQDVETSLAFAQDLLSTVRQSLAEKPFGAYLAALPADTRPPTWFAHDDYEQDRVAACYAALAPRWAPRLQGTERFLRSHCWTMLVGLAVDLPPAPSAPEPQP